MYLRVAEVDGYFKDATYLRVAEVDGYFEARTSRSESLWIPSSLLRASSVSCVCVCVCVCEHMCVGVCIYASEEWHVC